MNNPFEHIVGQTNAKNLLTLSLESAKRGESLIQPLIFGEAGLGKTEMAKTYGQAVAAEMGVTMTEYATPRDFRLVDDFQPVMEYITQSDSFVMYVDECHEIDTTKPAHQKFLTILRKCMDRQNEGKVIQVGDATMVFDRSRHVFILSTNHPEKVDTALQSRFNVINLSTYNLDEMEEITRRILEKNGMECDCPQTLRRIASCGRGTARPIVNLVNDVFALMGNTVIDNTQAMTALRMKEMYPVGLNANEVRVIDMCKKMPYTRMQILSALTGLHGTIAESIAYLIQKGFVEHQSAGYRTTEKGRKYLRFIQRENFTF